MPDARRHPDLGAHDRPVYDPKAGRPRCTADNRQGARCGNRPIAGGVVCRNHGGSAPQVRKAARLRLLELVDPALAALADVLERDVEIVHDEKGAPHVVPTFAERTKAAEAILDRTGHPRRRELDLGDARSRLLERIRSEADG